NRTKDSETHDRQEGQQLTSVWRNGGFSASYDSFVVSSSAVLLLNFCASISATTPSRKNVERQACFSEHSSLQLRIIPTTFFLINEINP
ncbi:MAG: hypothetical protein LC115_11835, partial [Bacteroidia bacterium]|nr:hypothetical protein [Bacteroidia bacterium]